MGKLGFDSSSSGWNLPIASETGKIWKRNNKPPEYRFESEPIPGTPLQILALIRESQLGNLAGDLLFWDEKQHYHQTYYYASKFPNPFSNRNFCVTERCGITEDNAILLFSCDAYGIASKMFNQQHEPMEERQNEIWNKYQSSNLTHGKVYYSVYHIKSIDQTHSQLVRFICLDMQLPWLFPRMFQDSMMTKVLFDNISWIKQQLETPGALEKYEAIFSTELYQLVAHSITETQFGTKSCNKCFEL
jgi:hypothetical protein